MVFFTSVIIVVVLYFLQADGLIYVTIIAVVAELFNLFMTQTLTKSVEKQTTKKFARILASYKKKITVQDKTIKDFQDLQEKSIKKLQAANSKIKAYEKRSTSDDTLTSKLEEKPGGTKKKQKTASQKISKKKKPSQKKITDLPSGSNRKNLPI